MTLFTVHKDRHNTNTLHTNSYIDQFVVGGSNEIQSFFRYITYLVSYKSEFHGVSFDTPYDILL